MSASRVPVLLHEWQHLLIVLSILAQSFGSYGQEERL